MPKFCKLEVLEPPCEEEAVEPHFLQEPGTTSCGTGDLVKTDIYLDLEKICIIYPSEQKEDLVVLRLMDGAIVVVNMGLVDFFDLLTAIGIDVLEPYLKEPEPAPKKGRKRKS